jgi:hypothetical protein
MAMVGAIACAVMRGVSAGAAAQGGCEVSGTKYSSSLDGYESMTSTYGLGCIPYNSPILIPLTRSQDYHLTSLEEGCSSTWMGTAYRHRRT